MLRFDTTNAECLVFTFKDGLLARLAHDLKIRVGTFSVEVADDRSAVTATFDARSLRTVCAREKGQDAHDKLSPKDVREIDGHIVDDVLHVARQSSIRFVSSRVTPEGDGFRVAGELTLHGKGRGIVSAVRREGDRLIVTATLDQRDWGV